MVALYQGKNPDKDSGAHAYAYHVLRSINGVYSQKNKFPTNCFVYHLVCGDLYSNSGRKFWHGGIKGCKSSKMLCPPVDDKLYRNNLLKASFHFTEIESRD